jgi:predicted nucleic acid-binding protein
MLDSGVYLAAFLCPKSSEESAIIKASEGLHKILVTDFLREEVYAFLREKFPEKLTAAEEFFGELEAIDVTEMGDYAVGADIIRPSADKPPSLRADNIRPYNTDITNHPIIQAAVSSRADILVTADTDFLESVIDSPKIMTVGEFLRYR